MELLDIRQPPAANINKQFLIIITMKKMRSVCVVKQAPLAVCTSEEDEEMFFRTIMALGEIEIGS